MNIVEVQCCISGCGHSPFPMAQHFYVRAQRTHEYWSCPAGHRQHWTGATEEERQHRAEKDGLRRQIARWQDHWAKAQDLSRTCPWPTCRSYVYSSRDTLYEHMRRTHGMPTLAAVQEQAS